MDYLTAALHSKSLQPPRAPVAYVSDLFDLEARRSAATEADRRRTHGATSDSPDRPAALLDSMKTDVDRGLFHEVHGLIFDHVAPNMRSMIEAALGLPSGGFGEAGSSVSGSRGGDRAWKWLDILDIGCGRGAMGTQLESLANYMEGIDLSEKALKHASRTGHYDSIRHEDAVSAVKTMSPSSFDLVVAADLLPYFGDLKELLRGISSVTRPGGLVAFNADALDVVEDGGGESGGGNARPFELRFTGRWSHRRRYITQCAATAGLTVLGVRVVKGRTRLVRSAAGKIVLEATPQERRSTIFLCGKGAMTAPR